MKSFLIIGMGKFGKNLALRLKNLGNSVVIIDRQKAIIDELSDTIENTYIGDCTKISLLKELGVPNFDVCVVAIGENFQSSLEITAHLKELGAKYIVAKASSRIQCKFLTMAGANETVYPQRDTAFKLATRYNANNVFDFIELTDEYSIYEFSVEAWNGKQIAELNVRNKYNLNIIAVKNEQGDMILPTAQYTFCPGDHIVALGEQKDIEKLTKKK